MCLVAIAGVVSPAVPYAARVTDGRHAFNPLDRVELGRSVGRALLLSPCEPLPPPERFDGAGIYAIYYQGGFDAYRSIAFDGCSWPIYLGRAMPAGSRKGLVGLGASPGRKLQDRLREHAGSITAVRNLELDDFRCRYLVVDDIWIPLAERLLIGHYRPLWNGVVDGFGSTIRAANPAARLAAVDSKSRRGTRCIPAALSPRDERIACPSGRSASESPNI